MILIFCGSGTINEHHARCVAIIARILDFVIAWSENRICSESNRTTMSVTRYISRFLPDGGQNRFSVDSSRSFSASFVTSCRFWLAANSIWATLVLVAAATVVMRMRIDKSWPLIAFVSCLSAGLVFRELWKSKLSVGRISVKTILILILGLASTGFLLGPCLIRGAFVSVAGDTFMYGAFGQFLVDHHRGFAFGLPPIDQYAMTQSETRFGTAPVLGFFSVLFIPAQRQFYLSTYL